MKCYAKNYNSSIITSVNGDWASGKAPGSGPGIGAKIAGSNLQENL